MGVFLYSHLLLNQAGNVQMNDQMSFNFPLDGSLAMAGRVPQVRRRRAVSLPAGVLTPAQLALMGADEAFDAPGLIECRLPIVVPVVERIVQESSTGVRTARQWQDDGWMARVIKSDDAEGWAVEMRRDGESDPVLVVPWRMAGDSPEPLEASAFGALVRQASAVLQRHSAQRQAHLHKRLTVRAGEMQWEVTLDIVPDEYDPHALLEAFDESGGSVARQRVGAHFKLTPAAARAWIEGDFRLSEGD